jgi:hypothetical protein
MPKDTREPQSYGSDSDWVTGKTGQEVNDQASAPPPEHAEFYDERREAEDSAPAQGGFTSPVQLAENAQASGHAKLDDDDSPLNGVTTTPGGAKRGGFFRKRDYE